MRRCESRHLLPRGRPRLGARPLTACAVGLSAPVVYRVLSRPGAGLRYLAPSGFVRSPLTTRAACARRTNGLLVASFPLLGSPLRNRWRQDYRLVEREWQSAESTPNDCSTTSSASFSTRSPSPSTRTCPRPVGRLLSSNSDGIRARCSLWLLNPLVTVGGSHALRGNPREPVFNEVPGEKQAALHPGRVQCGRPVGLGSGTDANARPVRRPMDGPRLSRRAHPRLFCPPVGLAMAEDARGVAGRRRGAGKARDRGLGDDDAEVLGRPLEAQAAPRPEAVGRHG